MRIQLDSANATIRRQAQELSDRGRELQELKDTVSSLREVLSEDKTAEWNEQLRTLNGSVELLQKEVALRDRELENRARRLETLTAQEQRNHGALEQLQMLLQKQCEQNEWAESENEELGSRLKEQMEQSIALSRENSRLKAANAILQRKLDTEQLRVRAAELAGADAE